MLFVIVANNIRLINKYVLVYVMAFLFVQVALSIAHSDFTYISFTVACLFSFISLFYSYKFIGINKLVNTFINIMLFCLLLSSITSVLSVLGLIDYVSVFNNPDGRESYNFILSFTNSLLVTPNGYFIRASGFFDEPGTLAYFASFAFFLNEIRKGSFKVSLSIAALTVLSTWSLAFIIVIGFYFIISALFNKKYTLYVCALSVILGGLLLVASNTDTDLSKRVMRLTVDRLSLSDDGKLKGDNRSGPMLVALDNIQQSPVFGLGRSDQHVNGYAGANIFTPFARDGVVGGLIYYSPFIILIVCSILKCRRFDGYMSSKEFVAIVCIGLNLLQRPNLNAGFEMIIMFVLAYAIYGNKRMIQ
ncbi:hypothetical protein AB4427_16435 [Vibrio artabrorum]|uniref:hypothetical protein n=1 Tax=Vibrio artabrorum TaxID=446374 RepID=UPI00355074F2